MTDLALVALFFIFMVAVVMLIHVTIGLPQKKVTKHPDALWQVEEHPRAVGPDGPSAYAVYCAHPDEEPQLVEAVYWNDPDFDAKCADARVEAQLRCQTLNNKLKLLKR